MCVRDEAVCCVLIVCLGLRDSMIGCILHVNARGSLEVYIWRRSARQADESVVEQFESVCVERLELRVVLLELRARVVGVVRVEVENC